MTNYRGKFSRPDKNGEYAYETIQGDIDCYTIESDNPATATIIHGQGAVIDWVWYDSQKAATEQDATFIFPTSMTREQVNVLKTTYEEKFSTMGNNSNVVLTGHSNGGPATLRALAQTYIDGNGPATPPTVVMLDGSFVSCKLTEEEKKVLAENNVPIIAYYQLDEQKIYYEGLGQRGLNIALIRDYDCRGHDAPCIKFFENEKGILSYAVGNGKLQLGAGGYTVSVWYDGEEVYTNGTNRYDISGIDSKDKLFAMWNINTFSYKITTLQELNSKTLTSLSFSINDNVLDLTLKSIVQNIGNTSFINSGFNLSSGIEAASVIKTLELATNYFVTTTDLLYHIANEMQEYTKIGPYIAAAEKNIIENNNNALPSVVPLSELTISEPIVSGKTENNNTTAAATTNVGSTTVENNSQVPTEKNEKNEPVEETKQQQDNKPKEDSDKKETQNTPENKTQTNQNTNQNKGNNNSNNNNNSYNNGNKNDKTNPLEQFPEYKEVYSDDKKIVYDYNNEYRIIVHKDGNEIIGIEHYYKFENESAATNALSALKLEYGNNQNMENIIQNGQYVKVIFKEEMYKNLTIPEIRKQYSQLNEIIKL